MECGDVNLLALRPVRRHRHHRKSSDRRINAADWCLFGATGGIPKSPIIWERSAPDCGNSVGLKVKNIEIDYRWARGSIERARSLAKELVGTSPALILTTGTEPALALRDTTATVPVVFINVTDPVAGGS